MKRERRMEEMEKEEKKEKKEKKKKKEMRRKMTRLRLTRPRNLHATTDVALNERLLHLQT